MIKLVAIDMDGTLLDSQNRISQENRIAISKALDQGIHVVIATGRAYREAVDVLQLAGLHIPVININGAQIHSENGDLIHSAPMYIDQVKKVHQIAMKNQIYHELFADQGIYPSKETFPQLLRDLQESNSQMMISSKLIQERLEIIRANIAKGQVVEQVINDPSVTYLKYVFFSHQKDKLALVSELLREVDGLAISSSYPTNIEINHRQAQKGIALEIMAKRFGVPMDQTMAIGDNWNDLSMFQVAGISVAMGNAEPEIARKCDRITKTNDDHGVAHAFEQWVL